MPGTHVHYLPNATCDRNTACHTIMQYARYISIVPVLMLVTVHLQSQHLVFMAAQNTRGLQILSTSSCLTTSLIAVLMLGTCWAKPTWAWVITEQPSQHSEEPIRLILQMSTSGQPSYRPSRSWKRFNRASMPSQPWPLEVPTPAGTQLEQVAYLFQLSGHE